MFLKQLMDKNTQRHFYIHMKHKELTDKHLIQEFKT